LVLAHLGEPALSPVPTPAKQNNQQKEASPMSAQGRLSGLIARAIGPATLAAIAYASHASAEVSELTVRYGAIPEPQLVAKEKGWFEQELGIPIDWITISGGANAIAAMQSGSLHIACGVGTPPIAAALAQGVPIRIFWIQDNAPESLAVKPEAAKSVAELDGKKIGALVGSTMYFALVVALGKEGLSPRDVDIIDLPVEETLAAFKRGDIDGAILPHPAIDELIAAGAVEIMTPVDRAEKYGYSLFDACIVLEDWAAANPETLAKWVAVEEKANAYVRANEADSLETIAKALNIDTETAKAGLAVSVQPSAEEQLDMLWLGQPGSTGTGVVKAIEITGQFQKDLGRIPDVPKNIDAAIDPSFVAKVVAP
jgi:taurine transport system substrate-binding protein